MEWQVAQTCTHRMSRQGPRRLLTRDPPGGTPRSPGLRQADPNAKKSRSTVCRVHPTEFVMKSQRGATSRLPVLEGFFPLSSKNTTHDASKPQQTSMNTRSIQAYVLRPVEKEVTPETCPSTLYPGRRISGCWHYSKMDCSCVLFSAGATDIYKYPKLRSHWEPCGRLEFRAHGILTSPKTGNASEQRLPQTGVHEHERP